MQAQIKSIQEQLASRNIQPATSANNAKPGCEGNTNSSLQKPGVSFACKNCKENGTAADCRHCSYCQGDNHFAKDCRKRQAELWKKTGKRERAAPKGKGVAHNDFC